MRRSPRVPGAPTREHDRSRAAARVARYAQRSSLFFAHYEHRAQLALPRAWRRPGADAIPARFVGGVLAEPKYQSFRHDLLVASFHPSHRAQWTAHELCHALVGFAYRPGASLLFHVLAAWLAELVPVALWYFFDEADLRRCARHGGAGPLFQTHCEACERAALRGPRPWDRASAGRRSAGLRYVKRELAAIARSRRRGLPEGTRFATIDLAEDAIQYAAAHAPRLRAPEMERFTAQFFDRGQGLHDSLDALEARVLEVCAALTSEASLRPLRGTRWDWAAQDVGYRLLSVRAGQSGALARALDGLIDALASARTERGLAACVRGYEALDAAQRAERTKRGRRALPSPARLFAVGYPLPRGYGSDRAQIAAGVASACPSTLRALGKRAEEHVRAFVLADRPERLPIGRRFARYLARAIPEGPEAELCGLEAAIAHVTARDAWADCLDPAEARGDATALARGVEIVMVAHDVLGLAPGKLARAARLPEERALIVLRRRGEPVDVLELSAALARPLARLEPGERVPHAVFADEPAARDALLTAGVLVPAAYTD